MEIDAEAIGAALGREIPHVHTNLCRAEIAKYEQALAGDEPLLVACTQEAPLFAEIAEEAGREGQAVFVNIREQAGWSAKGTNPAPKMAALLAEADYRTEPVRLKSIISDGLCLVYGSGQQALDVASLLASRLSVTLVLKDDADIVLPASFDVPVYHGRVAQAAGGFGSFEVTVDGYAPLVPSSRAEPGYVMPRNGAKSECGLILDISGETPLFTGHRHRDGYVRVDPGDSAAVMRAVFDLSGMVGEFEKPIYVDYDPDICAHSRSQKPGCSKCLDLCPAGAIQSMGDIVEIDALICGGCGACSAACPTGAVSYAFPARKGLIGRVQALLGTYREGGGTRPVLLLHEAAFGGGLIGAMARYGRGLPGNVLPLSLHAVTGFGHLEMAAAFAAGAERIVILADPQKAEELAGLEAEAGLTGAILAGMGHGEATRVSLLQESDPDRVEELLHSLPECPAIPAGELSAVGGKRDVARLVFGKLFEASPGGKPGSEPIIALPAAAPYGTLEIDTGACTLCMACVSACPSSALLDNPESPQLRFVESACVQCGLCVSTCPESALALEPRLNLGSSALQPLTMNEEEPFECIECGTPFASKSAIERVSAQLGGKHWMYEGEERVRLIQMCGDCRVRAQAKDGQNPMASGKRPKIRTTDDYLKADKKGLSVDDFLMDD